MRMLVILNLRLLKRRLCDLDWNTTRLAKEARVHRMTATAACLGRPISGNTALAIALAIGVSAESLIADTFVRQSRERFPAGQPDDYWGYANNENGP